MKTTFLRIAGAGLIVLTVIGVTIRAARPALAEANHTGYAYTLNNDGQGNGVVALARNADGTLSEIAGSPFATGGKGLLVPNGGDFDAQGAIRIHGKHLVAVTPGSNSIAVLNIGEGGALAPVEGSPFSSGGGRPAQSPSSELRMLEC